MSLKEEILQLKTYEEYQNMKEKIRENQEYQTLMRDREIICHISDLSPKADTMEEVFKYPGRRYESLSEKK